MTPKKVFISYSHDSPEHSERVLSLAWAMRNNGIDVELDQFHKEEIVDWPRWCNEHTSREHSEFVVCVCSAEYKRRLDGHLPPEKGKGVYWEGSLIDDEIYDEKGNRRLIPILFDDEPESSIPRFLRGWTHCRLRQFAINDAGYEHLIRILTGQASVEKNPLGTIPVLPTKRAATEPQALSPADFKADISRIIDYAPAELVGREDETKLLYDAWDKAVRGEMKRPHVLTLVALGGEGKTSVVAKWAAELAHQGWPGCDAAFAWSFYNQGTSEQGEAPADVFLKEALTFFGDDKDKEFAASNAGAYEKGQRLARVVSRCRSLLILDGLEPLQYAPTSPTAGELKDGGLAALLKGLATASQGLCVVTTRYSISDLKAFRDKTVLEKELKRLSRQAGVNLLQSLGVGGSLLRNIRSNDAKEFINEYEKLVEDVIGHALTLNLLGTYLRDAHGGDIRKRDLVKLSDADAEEQGGHAFRVMEAYESAFEEEGDKGKRALAVLRVLGLFDRPMTFDCFGALLEEPAIAGLTEPLMQLTDGQLNIALSRLQSAKLVNVNRDVGGLVSIDAHALLREYFARQLKENNETGWREGHRRLYEYLRDSTNEGDQPTLEDLQPLYQAVAHGCQAGLQQAACDNVYRDRILRGTGGEGFYSTRMLGAFGSDLGAVACFFETPWSRVSPLITEADQAWLLNQAAFRLRGMGRLNEALEPNRASLDMRVRQEAWKNASIIAGNVSDLELTLGEVAEAVGSAERSVTYADRSGDATQRLISRTTHADTLQQAGRRGEARERFREAEQMQKEQFRHPLLYSVQGFEYCDLLLAKPERAAWQEMQRSEIGGQKPELINECRDVSQRAAQTVKIAEHNNWLLDIGLDHLTRGRAALYASILDPRAVDDRLSAIENTDVAVTGLRRAGMQDHIPRGLVDRAWLRFLEGKDAGRESAKEDLDEAWEIAERGPMKLLMADIHLYRARLFHAVKPYPWNRFADGSEGRGPRDDLKDARKLIEQCGYWRRKEELEDAEEAAKNW